MHAYLSIAAALLLSGTGSLDAGVAAIVSPARSDVCRNDGAQKEKDKKAAAKKAAKEDATDDEDAPDPLSKEITVGRLTLDPPKGWTLDEESADDPSTFMIRNEDYDAVITYNAYADALSVAELKGTGRDSGKPMIQDGRILLDIYERVTVRVGRRRIIFQVPDSSLVIKVDGTWPAEHHKAMADDFKRAVAAIKLQK